MLPTKRLFIAAPLPDNLKTILQQYQPAFAHPAVRFLPASNLHLTVHFLGNVPAHQVPAIEQILPQVATRHAPFTLQLECLEPGPKSKAPRLVWARFRPQPAFAQLSAAVFEQLNSRPPDHADYIPHITLARFRKDAPRPTNLSPIYPTGLPILLPVATVALWESELQSPHPVYRILAEFPLGTEKVNPPE